jgi:predicted lipase
MSASYAKSSEEFEKLVGYNVDSVSIVTRDNSKCYIVKHNTDLHIVLTGSNDLLDFVQGSMIHMCDCRFKPLIDDDENKTNYTFRIHNGFHQYYTKIRNDIVDAVKAYLDDSSVQHDKKNLVFLGHSLGGSCVLPAFEAALMTNPPNIRVVTYGSPMVGSRLFAHMFADKVPNSVRIAIETDLVTTQFPVWLGYTHVGQYVKRLPPTNSYLYWLKTIQEHSHTRYLEKLRDFALDDIILSEDDSHQSN